MAVEFSYEPVPSPNLAPGDPVDVIAADLEQLVEDAEFRIVLQGRTGPGTSLSEDWWYARLEPLSIEHCDYGLDATMTGLTALVAHEVQDRLADPNAETTSDYRLLLKLWLAHRTGRLGMELQRSACFYDWDYNLAVS